MFLTLSKEGRDMAFLLAVGSFFVIFFLFMSVLYLFASVLLSFFVFFLFVYIYFTIFAKINTKTCDG